MTETVLYRFDGSDSLARFGVFVILTGAGAGPIVFVLFNFVFKTDWITTIAWVLGISTVIFVGLRSSIVVTNQRTTITKKWLFIPYWRCSAAEIEDVWYGGDWGDDTDALGIVVKLGKKEVDIGSRKTMHELYRALLPLSVKAKYYAQQRAPGDSQKPRT